MFAVGGMADLVWHQLFGIEVDLEALFSPSHLVLFVGAFMVVSSPLRSAWHDPASRTPTFRQLLPALLSVTLMTALTSFFLMPLSPFVSGAGTAEPYRFLAEHGGDLGPWLAEEIRLNGLASFLVTTVVLMAPALVLLRRWRLPAGSLTPLFVSVAALMAGVQAFQAGETVLAAVVGGVVADVLVARLRPSTDRPGAFRTVGAVVPAVLWLAYFGSLAVFSGVGWSVELWAGVTAMSSLAGFALALLMFPSALPHDPSPAEPLETEPHLQAVNVA